MQTMNYFGLFFSFMIPGIVLGAMGGYLLSRRQYRRQLARAAARRHRKAVAA